MKNFNRIIGTGAFILLSTCISACSSQVSKGLGKATLPILPGPSGTPTVPASNADVDCKNKLMNSASTCLQAYSNGSSCKVCSLGTPQNYCYIAVSSSNSVCTTATVVTSNGTATIYATPPEPIKATIITLTSSLPIGYSCFYNWHYSGNTQVFGCSVVPSGSLVNIEFPQLRD